MLLYQLCDTAVNNNLTAVVPAGPSVDAEQTTGERDDRRHEQDDKPTGPYSPPLRP